MNQTKRNCRMCGKPLPPLNHYQTDGCGMCGREIWERQHHSRYYVKTKSQDGLILYEEVQSLRGICPFDKKNHSLIQTTIQKEREILNKTNE